ncbi:MAG TPA: hypothetical protein VGV35_00365 [Bryobacteraceae bacterium]|nr:hypothetical protein [Bryobacteraceae bacterium]
MKSSIVAKFALLGLVCYSGIFAQQKSMPPATTERPLADRVASFERPERVERMKPDEVIKALNLTNGAVVADVGAGSGVMTRRFAKAVGLTNIVFVPSPPGRSDAAEEFRGLGVFLRHHTPH